MQSLMDLLDAGVDPQQIILEDAEGQYSREALSRKVRVLALRLQALGIQRLALHADNSLEWVLVDLACMQAGIVSVPLPLFFSPGQLQHALIHCAVDALLTCDPSQFAGADAAQESGFLRGLTLFRYKPQAEPLLPQGTGKITFTSGSTGNPKGVCLSWPQQLAQARVLRDAVAIEYPVHLCVLPLSTLLENVAGLYAPLLAGGRVVLRTMREMGFAGSSLQQPHLLLAALSGVQPDTVILLPQLLQFLVLAARGGWQAPAFRFVAVGGSRIAAAQIDAARALGMPVYEGYGLSECASVVCLNTPVADLPGSCGRPLPQARISLEQGEIHVRGNLMLGYLNEPASWYPDTVATGDLGYVDAEGYVHINGRRKNLLISSYGRNVAPEWIESELQATGLFRDFVVVGDAKPWCGALLSPLQHALSDAAIQLAVDKVNETLPDYARIRGWQRLAQPLAAEPGLLTANGRPRRDAIGARFQKQIEALYGEPQVSHNTQLETSGSMS